MVTKYNAVIVVRGKSVTSKKWIVNKPMPFIINTSKQMADHVNHMEFTSTRGVSISAETLDALKYEAILSSINIRFKRVK